MYEVTTLSILLLALNMWRLRQVKQQLAKKNKELTASEESLKIQYEKLETTLAALSKSEERYKLAMDGANDGLWDYDILKDEMYLSERIREVLGLTGNELIKLGPYLDKVVYPEDRPMVDKLIEDHFAGKTPYLICEHRSITPQGMRWVFVRGKILRDASGRAIRIAGSHTDITEKKSYETDLARFDRLNLIGEMAASIGHEVRNPMTTVRGYLQIFQCKEKFAKYQEELHTMIAELDRANFIITEFLSLAKNKKMEMTPGNLNAIIHMLFPLIQADAFRMGHDIQIATNEIPDIQLDHKEIKQLILNLTRNGLEAMQRNGTLTIKTYLDDDKVILAIQDTGTGIPEDVISKLGTPFVTTKETGTGLGLSVCYRISQRHGADIDVATGCQGTTFFIKFHKR